MHDGAVAQGDTWLQANLAGYITWAKTHNSIFVLTFDEDENIGATANRIPTIITGAGVTTGTYLAGRRHQPHQTVGKGVAGRHARTLVLAGQRQ